MRLPAELLRPWRRGACLLLLGLSCAINAPAQAQDDSGAPPDRVARLSYIAGDLGLLPAGSQDWMDANLNRPLTTGDRLASADDARAELELGGAAVRLAGNTDVGLLNLGDQIAQLELTHGSLGLSVRRLDAGQRVEIDTPTLALVVDRPGRYRIDVDADGGGTRVAVQDGQATVYGDDHAQRELLAGRSYQFDDASLTALTVSELAGGDAFDAWCASRDQRYASSGTRRYVSTEVIGWQDLDDYGDWRDSSDYGAVWYPSRMPVGWAPYRDGHWAYIAPWGWTWVDAAPWGFAPYHYGRWAWIGGAWGWVPGPLAVRPVYAPALVVFVGGGRWGASFGRGGAPVGWYPLGPGQLYNPWYHCGRRCYRQVNYANLRPHAHRRDDRNARITRGYHDYRNGRAPPPRRYVDHPAPHGFTAMPGRAFADGRRAATDRLRIDPRQLNRAPVLLHGPANLRPAASPARPAPPEVARRAAFRREVLAHTPPPARLPATRQPFAPRTTPRQPPPFPHVRVLDGHAPPPRRIDAERLADRPLRRPAVRRIDADTQPTDGLPSARFAQPRPQPRELSPRVYRPSPEANRARTERPPAMPRYERRSPLARPAAEMPRFEPRAHAPRSMPLHEPAPRRYEPARRAPAPRFERPSPPPRPAYTPPQHESHPAPAHREPRKLQMREATLQR